MERVSRGILGHPTASVVVFAAVVRAVVGVAVAPASQPDTSTYLAVAHLISRHDLGHWNGVRTPGYPLLIWAAGSDARAVVVVQQVMGVVAAALLARVVRHALASTVAGLVAGALYATSVTVLFAEVNLLTEALAMFLVVVALAALDEIVADLRSGRGLRTRWALLLGVDLAWLGLTRPSSIVLTPVLALAVILVGKRPRSSSPAVASGSQARSGRGPPGLVPGVAVVVALPLAAFAGLCALNRHATGQYGPSNLQGYALTSVTCTFTDKASPRFRAVAEPVVRAERREVREHGNCANGVFHAPGLVEVAGPTEADISRHLTDMSIDLVRHHPDLYLRVVVQRGVMQWDGWNGGPPESRWKPVERLISIGQGAGRAEIVVFNAAFLATVAVWSTRAVRRRRGARETSLALVAASLIALVTALENPVVDYASGRLLAMTLPCTLAVGVAGVTAVVRARQPVTAPDGGGSTGEAPSELPPGLQPARPAPTSGSSTRSG